MRVFQVESAHHQIKQSWQTAADWFGIDENVWFPFVAILVINNQNGVAVNELCAVACICARCRIYDWFVDPVLQGLCGGPVQAQISSFWRSSVSFRLYLLYLIDVLALSLHSFFKYDIQKKIRIKRRRLICRYRFVPLSPGCTNSNRRYSSRCQIMQYLCQRPCLAIQTKCPKPRISF